MTLEKRGTPTLIFCTESMSGIVRSQAQLSGMPSYRPVTVPGHIVALSPQQAIAKIDQVADEILTGLVQG